MNTTVTNFYSNDKVEDCPQLNIPEYAFIGRSNVGKSSLINLLLNQKVAYTSSKPGKTQLINHIIVENSWALVDLPGYGYAKLSKTERNKILKRNRTYFTNRGLPLVAVFMLIDIRIPPQKIDLQKMEWLVKNNVYFIENRNRGEVHKIDNKGIKTKIGINGNMFKYYSALYSLHMEGDSLLWAISNKFSLIKYNLKSKQFEKVQNSMQTVEDDYWNWSLSYLEFNKNELLFFDQFGLVIFNKRNQEFTRHRYFENTFKELLCLIV